MALSFPSNPSIGEQVQTGGAIWEWDGERWLEIPNYNFSEVEGPIGFTGSKGSIGYVGSRGVAGAPTSKQLFVGDGLSTRFFLNEYVHDTKSIFVMLNGLVLIPDVDYIIQFNNELVLNSVPNELSDIEVRYFSYLGYRGSTGATGYRGSVGYYGSSGLALVYMGPNAPPILDRIDGELWWDTDNGILNIYYADENTWLGIAEGPRGPMGNLGFTGSIGPRGFSGSIGHTGSRGYAGSLGYVGSKGIGEKGEVGYPGYTGSRGYNGSVGYVGSIGYTGSIGYSGSRGEVGYIGSNGYFGSVGFTGSLGIGYAGSVGSGYVGSKGYAGSLGYTGSLGYSGSQGVGYTGSIGSIIGNATVSRSLPSGGINGDIWFRYV
jgi:hypothetical protein